MRVRDISNARWLHGRHWSSLSQSATALRFGLQLGAPWEAVALSSCWRIIKMAANFATRYKKDLSTSALKTKLVRRKSILQKESRHKEFNKGRQFGLVDVNRPLPGNKELSRLEETGEVPSPKTKAKPSQTGNSTVKQRRQERLEMLQRYKTEKELRKLKEQREKPVFRVGRYKPEIPSFLPSASQIPVLSKPKEKVAVATAAPSVRLTRSQAKKQLEDTVKSSARPHFPALAPTYPSKGCRLQPAQHQKIYIDQPPKKESKGAQPSVPRSTNGRTTRATAAAPSKIPRARQLTTDNLPQKRGTRNGKQQRDVKNGGEMVLREMKEIPMVEAVKEEAVKEERNSQIPPAIDTEQDEVFFEKENMPAPDIPVPALPRRTRSFAPQNFLFKPPEGVVTYKVAPMTPSRADVFLSPNLCWSPSKSTSESLEEDVRGTIPQDCLLKCSPSPNQVVAEQDFQERPAQMELVQVKPECLTVSSNEAMEAVPCEMEDAVQPVDLSMTEAPDLAGEPQHNVAYFRKILRSEMERLTSHCLEWDGTDEKDIPEEAKDLVRTTVGQSRLLMAERFKQFEGLVDNCEFRRGEKETTCADLDGFWDMVNFQVEDVNKKFENLRQLQKNGWQMVDDVQHKRPAKKKAALQRAARPRGGSAERTAARKRLHAIKAVMKNKMKQEGMAEATDPEGGKVVFDGGFFQVESPAKPLPGWIPKSAAGTPQQNSRLSTPRSARRAFLQSCADTCVARSGPSVMSSSFLNPSGSNLDCISEQSDTQPALESCAKMEDTKGDANEMQTLNGDEHSPTREMDGLVSVHSQDLAHSDLKMEVPDTVEGVKQVVTGLHKQDVLCSPGMDAPSERTRAQAEVVSTLGCETGPLLSDFSCDDVALDLTPNPDCSLFTPLRSETTTAVTCNDLIVFSPLDGEK